MSETDEPRVAIVGGGVAGLMAGTYCARNGFDTVVVNHGESILRRNAHLENVPGFPAGVNSRTFLNLLYGQAGRNGCLFEDGRVIDVSTTDDGFRLRVEDEAGASETAAGEADATAVGEADAFELLAEYVIAASWADVDYLADLDGVELIARGSKTYVDFEDCCRTGVEGLYAAGRIAEKAHQTVVAAGHGAEVALTLIDDSPVPFYHDWVAPKGYFTGRGRDIPPGVEEIDEAERRRRERESMESIRDAFESPHPGEPTMHPSVVERRSEGEK